MKQHKILVLRPYGPRIREKMFATLERLGLRPDTGDILASSLTDREIVDLLDGQQAGVLLCPYNNIKLPDGQITNGLRLLRQIERAGLSQFAGVPVLMPVSIFSAPMFESELRGGVSLGPRGEQLTERLLTIHEEDLEDQAALAERIRIHIAKVRGTAGTAGAQAPEPAAHSS